MSAKPKNDAGSRPAILVNGRYRVHRITGVQRYAHEIVLRLGDEVELCTPRSAKGAVGHLWEQTVLPLMARGRLLWSPSGSGPLGYNRQVVTFHDLFPIEFPECYSAAYARWYGFAMPALASRAVHLIAVSEYTKSRIVALLGRAPEDITVIHNGCHTAGRASENEIGAAASALKLPSRRYVLSLSSLEKRKNLPALLQAWIEIYRDLPEDTWLVLAGPRVEESVYGKQQIGTDLPRVLFTGYVPEQHLAGLYSGASLFVFPSLAEGFGLPLLEAMSCGVRSISSRTSSLPEVGGEVVEYIDPQNPAQIGHAILKHFRLFPGEPEPYAPGIERASKFTWDAAAAKTRNVLGRALGAGRRVLATELNRTSAL
ncbi:MAG TPA: glycosyltransferase family 1 protein [Acidisarcina sp.]